MRLDIALVERGLAKSRNKANKLIIDGLVKVDGTTTLKPAKDVQESESITISKSLEHKYVSRSAYKLLSALQIEDPIIIKVNKAIIGAHCLDIGASTGGFTQVLLEAGAKDVVALDVGHGQLDSLIAEDDRVINFEGVNFRELLLDDSRLGEKFDVVVCDVSFISLKHIIPKIHTLCKNNAYVILLVKPQFEVGVDVLRKFSDAVITDTAVIGDVVDDITKYASDHHLDFLFTAPAKLTGKNGNQEHIAIFKCLASH